MKRRSVASKVCSIILAAALVFGLFPTSQLPLVSAAVTDIVYGAAYAGAQTTSDTNLPSHIIIGGQAEAVTWQIAEDSFDVPYDTVTITGTAAGEPVIAQVLVIPPKDNPLKYFIDSGRGGDSEGSASSASPFYNAVKALTEDELLNELPDQRYVSGTTSWGFDDSVHKLRNSKVGNLTDPATDPSIWVVGLRVNPNANNSADVVYKLTALEPGTYTLSSGFHDWYGNRSREMRPQLEYENLNGDKQSILLTQFNTNATTFISDEFTIPEDVNTDVPMTLTYAYVSGERPILSWFAIAEGEIKDYINDARQAAASVVNVLLDGNDIKANNKNGLTFKGFGVLSANSTSALLLDYKTQHPDVYEEMLQILFGGDHPIMTQVKIEMGNDRNNSTGPDPATMRTEDEEANVRRHPGFQLAADAKAINPDLKVSILRWNAPAWANNNNDKIYKWYKNTILAAYREFGYMVDFVNPHINEHAPDLTWTKQYANRVKADNEGFESPEEQALYNKIKVVISDEVGIGSFGGSMVSDASLREAAPIAGYHYNTDDDSSGNFKKLAEQYDIEVWNSEAQATFSNSAFRPNNNKADPTVPGTGIGGTGSALEMANTIIKGFVNSRRTHFIYQPAIGSFYEGGQYSFKELLSARDPWSGWIHYDAGLVILQHFSRFANIGWENEDNTAGIWRAVPQASSTGATGTNPVNGRNGIPNYMTLAAPDKSDFSTIIVNDSEYTKTYKIKAINMSYSGTPQLEAWETRAAEQGEAFNSYYMNDRGQLTADGSGTYTIKVKPYSIVTISTLESDNYTPLPVEGERTVLDTDATGEVQNTSDNVLYADNFDYSESYILDRGGVTGAIPRYTHDRNGAFEAYLDESGSNYVLRQQLDRSIMGLGGTWNNGEPVTAIGDNRWTNYKASVDVSFENDSTQGGANYAAIGARYQGGGSSHSISGTPYVLKFWFDGGWQLVVNNSVVSSGNVATGVGGVTIPEFDTAHDAWHNIAIEVAGNTITAFLDDVKLATYRDANPKLSGRVDLASGYYHVRFDNLLVETVNGYTPYYAELIDDLEKHDLAPTPAVKLIYNDLWRQENGQGMFHYQRSLSTSTAAGAALTYTFTGTGLDILGPNGGTAKLEVTVDGDVLIPSASTVASNELYQTYALRGLEYGVHTVQFKVLSGTLVIDAVGVIDGSVIGDVDMTALQAVVAEAADVEHDAEYSESGWQRFVAARSAAELALEQPAAYRLDQEGAKQLASRLTDAANQLLYGDVRELSSPHYFATYVGETPNLPSKIAATHEDGSPMEVAVTWNLDDVSFNTPYSTVAVTGSLGSLTTTAYIEVVPKNITYFVDVNGVATGSLGYDSPAYLSVAALAESSGKPLFNNKPDQVYNAASGWGHEGRNAGGSLVNNYKGTVSGPYNKQITTGLYTQDQIGSTLSYSFGNLPAGDYTVTVGSYSWWASYARTAEVSLIHNGESEVVDSITLNSSSFDVVRTYNVTLQEAGTLKLQLKATGANQSPMLSFVGVAQVLAEEPVVNKDLLQSLYNAHKDKVNDGYTAETWGIFQTALSDALNVLNDDQATQEQVDEAWEDLATAVAALQQEVPEVKLPTSYDQVVVATYAGEVPNLPAIIKGRAADTSVVDNIYVEWETLSADDVATPYGNMIMVTGQAHLKVGAEQTRHELETPVTAYVEVVGKDLVYFIDAGAGNPYIYDAVAELAGASLLNDSTNQVYDADAGWGYIALSSGGAVKPIINKSAQPDLDKNATGIMIDGGDPLSTLAYRLDGLEGGKSYRFTSYHRLWWNNEMPMKIALSYLLNGERITHNINRLHLDHTDHSAQVTYSINLPVGATEVQYVLTNVGSYNEGPGAGKTNKNAAISWLAVEKLDTAAEAVVYDSIGGLAGDNTEIWLDNNGVPIQAHGGQVQWVEHVSWDGDTPSYTDNPGTGDGAWLWVGEDKTYGGRPIGGIHTYVSKDLYNWVDMGVALYPHRVFPVEMVGSDGVQVSETQLDALKARAMATAGEGVNELGQTLTQFDIDYARDFLQAYVDREAHPSYSRDNDEAFDYINASYDDDSLLLAFDRTYAYYTIMERPKMLYNDATNQYVIVYHVDGPSDARIVEQFNTLKNDPMANTGISRYSRAQMGFAVSESPFGPFKLVNAQKMNYIEGYYDSNKGMARDMTVFKDDDGKAYAIYSSEENKYTYISLLNDTYTAPVNDGTEGLGETFTARIFTDASREAPAVFKYDGYYYFITSGTTGWDPNPSIAYRANHIFGNTNDGGETFTAYTKLGNPFPNDSSNTSYRTQSTAVIPIDPENGMFIYMGDRWIQRALETSGYVWLPLKISGNGTKVEGVPLSNWKLEQLDEYAPIKILSATETKIGLGETIQLPTWLDVQKGSNVYTDVTVAWDQASLNKASLSLGTTLVQGTLGGELSGQTVDYEVTVTLPAGMIYFVNPSVGTVEQYDQLISDYVAEQGETLRHDVPEQSYDPSNGNTWGYVSGNSTLRTSTTDIFQSLRYVNSSNPRSLTYKFELEEGSYNVYLGFYDPWYSSSLGNRLANTIINGVTVESNRVFTGSYDIAGHNDIVLSQDGVMEVVIAPARTGSNTDVQLSWIIVSKVEEQEVPDTEKPVITLLGEATVEVENGAAYIDAGATAADHVDGELTSEIVTTITLGGEPVAELNTTVAGTYTFHYNVSDAAGNAADEVTRTVVVKASSTDPEPNDPEDTVKPVITLLGEATVEVENGAAYIDAGATAADYVDGELTSEIVTTITLGGEPVAELDTTVAGTYTFHYNVSDAAGNAADEVTRTVIVKAASTDPEPNDPEDTTKPVITLLGNATVRVQNGASYTDAGATAADDVDGDITGGIVVTITRSGQLVSGLDTKVAGTYTFHYNVSDAAGNAADEVTRSVIVRAKETTPSTPDPTPTPTPTPPILPDTTQQLDKEDFKQGEGAELVVEVAEGKDAVHLPSNVDELVGKQALQLNQGQVSVELSNDLLKGLLQAAGNGQTTGMTVQVLASEQAKGQAAEQIAQQSTANTGLTAASEVAELTVTITLQDGETVPVTEFTEPVTLSLTVDSEANANLLGVYRIADDGTLQYIGGKLVDGVMQAEVDQPGQYVVLEYNKQFDDVSDTFWANDVIKELAAKHIVNGVTDELFVPNGDVTRAEFTTLIARVLGLQVDEGTEASFTDVNADAWYTNAIIAANKAGIIQGKDAELFDPNAAVTREEMAVIVMRAYQYAKGTTAGGANDGASFSDYDQVSGWAKASVQAAQSLGILNGHSDGRFAPQSMMTRAESVQVLYNLLKLLEE